VAVPDSEAELWDEARRRRVARREKIRRQRAAVGWKSLGAMIVTGAASFVIFFFIAKSYASYREFDGQVKGKTAALRALEEQQKTARAHLTLLESDKGRAQLLVERGYVRPGERILLFPARPNAKESRLPDNDLAPVPTPAPPTTWQRIGSSVRKWF
jgi:cell division protein FtsB